MPQHSGNHRVAILFSDDAHDGLTHSFFSGILDSFKNVLEDAGYNVGFLNVPRNISGAESYVEQMVSNDYEGVLIVSINYEDPSVIDLLGSEYPIVTIDHPEPSISNVSSDNVGGMREMVNYILDMGHSRIAYICGDMNTVTNLRLDCFVETCASRGIKIPQEYIRHGKFRALDQAAYETEQLLMLPIPPTCIIYSDDYAAIGGKNVIRARGLHVPADISIIGYDGIDVLDKIEPVFSTVRQDTREMGRLAGTRLINLIEKPAAADTSEIIVPTVLEKGHTLKRIYV